LIGIEHFVLKGAAAKVSHERRSHVSVVLQTQREMVATNEISADALGKVASASSSRSLQNARHRAMLSA
jgi:hypothetical protein